MGVLGAIREIPADTRYGFGGALVTHRRTRLAVIPAGFSDSLLVPRDGKFANVSGHLVPIAVSLEHADLESQILVSEFLTRCDPVTRDMFYRRSQGFSWKEIGKVYGISAHAAESCTLSHRGAAVGCGRSG